MNKCPIQHHAPGFIFYNLFLYFWVWQVPLPEEPDTEDEAEIRKWKWKVRSVKKENSERHSQRCDIELKLAVRCFYINFIVLLNALINGVLMLFQMGAGGSKDEG